MKTYPIVCATLLEFDLITQEQYDAAAAVYDDMWARYYERQATYQAEWEARRAARSWLWRATHRGWWLHDWTYEPEEVRWPKGDHLDQSSSSGSASPIQ